MSRLRLRYDPDHTLSYGYFRCTCCRSEFYGGGHAIHAKDCAEQDRGYEACDYHFGPEQVQAVKKSDAKWGWYGITLAELEAEFPHLL